MIDVLKAPFPWFGGKSRVASLVWERFGDVPHYCEPFFGSGAVLLRRPHDPRTETINDLDCYVSNFWRAVQSDPESVAAYADWPINECDLHARHVWLVEQKANGFRERMQNEPEHFDAKIAGWWAWGLSAWIGSGWCEGGRKETRPEINAAKGVNSVAEQVPILTRTQGVIGKCVSERVPLLNHGPKGVFCKRPDLNNFANKDGKQQSGSGLLAWMFALATRLRRVRVCCGDWSRICTDAVVFNESPTAVFLDPPYLYGVGRDENLYSTDSGDVANAVREWAIVHGDDKRLKIALCGYEGEHVMPDSWDCVAWKSNGGYGNQGTGRGMENRGRERIWLSPYCLKPKQGKLF
jgi:DNA adenine methylase